MEFNVVLISQTEILIGMLRIVLPLARSLPSDYSYVNLRSQRILRVSEGTRQCLEVMISTNSM